MSRNLAGVYSLPAGSIVATGDTILPTQHNTPLNDIASDLNLPRPVVAGGTGADNAADALVNLGLTATAAELNVLDGITASTAELNILDGVTATAAEINAVDGVTATGTSLIRAADAAAARSAISLGGLATLDILDEDDFATNSATRPPSQQSTAVYITDTTNARLTGGSLRAPTRAFATSYQNTQGRDIIVAPTISSTSNAVLALELSADGSSWAAVGRQTVATPNQVTYSAVIPINFYYRVTTSAGTGVVNAWTEVY